MSYDNENRAAKIVHVSEPANLGEPANLARCLTELEKLHTFVSDLESGSEDILRQFNRANPDIPGDCVEAKEPNPVNVTYPEIMLERINAIRFRLNGIENRLQGISELIG